MNRNRSKVLVNFKSFTMEKALTVLLLCYYFFGVLTGIFKFKLVNNQHWRTQKSKFLRVYGIVVHTILLFVALPYCYVYYFAYVKEKTPEKQKFVTKITLDLQFFGVAVSFPVLLQCLYSNRIDIEEFINEAIALRELLIDSKNLLPSASLYFRLILMKSLILEMFPLFSVTNKAISLYLKFKEPKIFSLFILLVIFVTTTFSVMLTCSTFLYCAYLIEILNVRLSRLIDLKNDFSTSLYREINEILILHERVVNFVLKLTKFSGVLVTACLLRNFVTIVSQVPDKIQIFSIINYFKFQFFVNFAMDDILLSVFLANMFSLWNNSMQILFIIYASFQVTETNLKTVDLMRRFLTKNHYRNLDKRVNYLISQEFMT